MLSDHHEMNYCIDESREHWAGLAASLQALSIWQRGRLSSSCWLLNTKKPNLNTRLR